MDFLKNKSPSKNKQTLYYYFINIMGGTLQNMRNIKLLHIDTVNGFVLK